MKKAYQKPSEKEIKVQYTHQLLTGSPDTHDEVSEKPSYARENRSWFDDENE